MTLSLTGNDLTLEQLFEVVFNAETAALDPAARVRMQASRDVVDRLVASDSTAYGINTGFGKMASVRISREQIRTLQTNLVRSHSCGVGAPLANTKRER
jgi:histidine ammonia-lyase